LASRKESDSPSSSNARSFQLQFVSPASLFSLRPIGNCHRDTQNFSILREFV
jgi:hypothetical protein